MSSNKLSSDATTKTWFGNRLDPRHNSLNMIRLFLAFAVLVHHSWPLTGAPGELGFAGETVGGWAVAGFFGISGYLITSSRWSNALGPYLVNRIARIMPAFWVCLLAIVVFFAPVGYLVAHGTLRGYLTSGHSPINFLFSNAFLQMKFYDVAGTPLNVPYAGAWNGSLWSLYYEFICYLLIAALGIFAFVRRSRWPLTVALALSIVAKANIGTINRLTNDNFDVVLLLQLLPFFLAGAVLFVWKDKLGFHWIPGILSLVAAFFISSTIPVWGVQASALFVAYGIIWLSTVLKQPALIAKNDISYGVYIYAFAVQQLLAVFGAQHWGLLWFSVAAAILTVPLATASWLWVERPVMRHVRLRKGGKELGKTTSGLVSEPAPNMISNPEREEVAN
ncbi:acyltransferase [Arthrobacter sp. GMC3]|uniref:acyltransferase family protein n=1 Tax=Arthrobacter sp. GMC3 TaxID=2058894 RepID=UPI0015E279B8|nr:acyltransferase [Arthrobacter sp. GMC3]